MNSLNMEEEKFSPLSDTKVTGKPWVTNTVCNLSIVCDADEKLTKKLLAILTMHLQLLSKATSHWA